MQPSQEWFDDLVEQTRDGLARYVGRFLMSPEDVQEVLQEAYLKVFVELRQDGPAGHIPTALLYRIARNIAISRLRHQSVVLKSANVVAIAEELRAERTTVEQDASQSQRLNSLLLVVNGLAPKCREVFILRWIHSMSQRAIGERLGISVSTVEKHLARGLRHCKDALSTNESSAAPERVNETREAAS